MFAENRLAPCMGSTVCEEYAGDDGADAAATWVVLKACVAEWELRLRLVSPVGSCGSLVEAVMLSDGLGSWVKRHTLCSLCWSSSQAVG